MLSQTDNFQPQKNKTQMFFIWDNEISEKFKFTQARLSMFFVSLYEVYFITKI